MPTPYARRPGYNTVDKPVNLKINQYRVEQAANIKVYQYAVSTFPACLAPSSSQLLTAPVLVLG